MRGARSGACGPYEPQIAALGGAVTVRGRRRFCALFTCFCLVVGLRDFSFLHLTRQPGVSFAASAGGACEQVNDGAKLHALFVVPLHPGGADLLGANLLWVSVQMSGDMATDHVNGNGTEEPMDTTAEVTHSEHFQALLEAGLPQKVAEKLDELYVAGKLQPDQSTVMPTDLFCKVCKLMSGKRGCSGTSTGDANISHTAGKVFQLIVPQRILRLLLMVLFAVPLHITFQLLSL